jgi:hypothetical protein
VCQSLGPAWNFPPRLKTPPKPYYASTTPRAGRGAAAALLPVPRPASYQLAQGSTIGHRTFQRSKSDILKQFDILFPLIT